MCRERRQLATRPGPGERRRPAPAVQQDRECMRTTERHRFAIDGERRAPVPTYLVDYTAVVDRGDCDNAG